jgi:hypothetical protein
MEKIEELERKVKRYKEQLNQERGRNELYKSRIGELKVELDQFKEATKYGSLSNQAASFVDRQLEITSECNTLAEKIAVMALDVPSDIPDLVRETYLKSFEKLAKACNQSVVSLGELSGIDIVRD